MFGGSCGQGVGIMVPHCWFVMMGFDHCIAIQFSIPVGLMYGAGVSVRELF